MLDDINKSLKDAAEVDKKISTIYCAIEWEDGDFRTITHGDAAQLLLQARILELHVNRALINGLAQKYTQEDIE